jgi:selenocysteine-specific elongation factor
MRHIILGTAGHIDHGKSSLVKALTGIDPDRLKEEKERGITIDIGFADLVYPESDLTVGIVDVPGHEKLIRNMLAGAGGIDIVLLVVAADEGIMPQSREHLSICNLLKIQSGLVALTKADLVEEDWISLVKDEIRDFVKGTFLEGSPVIPVSSRTGRNVDLLKQEIKNIALSVTPKTSDGLFRLPIDRVFTLKGFGTVITGTAVSGKISVEDALEILPSSIETRVRGLHSHGRAISAAYAGQRVAINLQGVEKEDLTRGDVAVTPARFIQSRTLDVFFRLLPNAPSLKTRSLVHFYAGTSETVARVILYEKEELRAGESAYCQFRLHDPVVVMSGDRYIVRRFSPLETLGGGEVLDPSPLRRRRKEGIADLQLLHTGTLEQKLSLKTEKSGASGISVNSLEGWIHAGTKAISDALRALELSGEVIRHEDLLIHRKPFGTLCKGILAQLKNFHGKNPLKAGMPKEEIRNTLKVDPRLFNFVLTNMTEIVVERNLIRLKDFRVSLSTGEETLKTRILESLQKGAFQPPTKEELSAALKMDLKPLSDIVGILVKEGALVKINESIFIPAGLLQEMMSLLKSFFSKKDEITVAEFRDLLQTTRKYALPFLEYLDSHKITVRTGDVRKFIRKNHS